MQTNLIIRLGLVALVILFLATLQYRARTKGKKDFSKFYNSKIEGEIEYIGHSVGLVYFTVKGTKYGFMPLTIDRSDKKSFFDRAEKKDLIFKPRLSDTLLLIKGGRHFGYTFNKLTD